MSAEDEIDERMWNDWNDTAYIPGTLRDRTITVLQLTQHLDQSDGEALMRLVSRAAFRVAVKP